MKKLLLLKREKSFLGVYSPTIVKNVFSLVLQIFLNLEAFESNTTVQFSQNTDYPIIVLFLSDLQNHEEKDKKCSRMVGAYKSWVRSFFRTFFV